jgi:hypothetical protein
MKKRTVVALLGIVVAFLMASGCKQEVVVGSGPVITHGGTYAETFRGLDVSQYTVHVTKSDKYRAYVRINKNLFGYYFMEIRRGILHIGYKDNPLIKRATSEAYVEMPEVREIRFSEATNGELSGNWSMPSLKVDLSGASTLKGSVTVDDLKAALSCGSHLILRGGGKKVDLLGSYASIFELRDFNSGDVTINLSGASHVTVSAYGNLSGELNGTSSLVYRGESKLGSLKTSSDASIRRD